MNQNALILNHLRTRDYISPLEALQLYGCMRLGARIYDLRRQGFRIKTIHIKKKNIFGREIHYAVYELEDTL